MNAMHGAVRTTGYGPVPERVFAESYEVCVNNKRGRVPREGVSCRKEHRTSPMGHFTAGFVDGAPVKRSGYMVTCARDSDCRRRCPIHPLTGEHYYCQKKYELYGMLKPNHTPAHLWARTIFCTCADYAYTDDDGGVSFHDLDEAHSGDPDREAMAQEGDTGICVDYNYLVCAPATP